MINVIVAMGKEREIGLDNQLLWRLSGDLKFFKNTTSGNAIIMGRNTYESIGRPLPNRQNIVISRNPNYKAEGIQVAGSLEEAFRLVEEGRGTFVCGGAQIYKQVLEQADKLFVTHVNETFKADTWFPDIDAEVWKEIWREEHQADEKNEYDYAFVEYIKK